MTRALLQQAVVGLRLYFRNTMALLYGYLFPTVFLIAFWTLYRYDEVPLVRHVGELLTITVLGGACFGLPTTMVGERERGVWRRYRLTPVPTPSIVLSIVLTRYLLLLSAGVLQIMLGMLLGMPPPRHPLQLWIAFTFVSFAFLGLGLVIATLADSVPAVQALGQTLFLPMLIIGGVAVPLTTLPDWAQHVSAFLPGRYAVEVIQSAAAGDGLGRAWFSLTALAAIGAAACVAGGKLFRWDRDQRFAAIRGKGWLAVAVTAWIVVGIAAEARGGVRVNPSAVSARIVQQQEAPPVQLPAAPQQQLPPPVQSMASPSDPSARAGRSGEPDTPAATGGRSTGNVRPDKPATPAREPAPAHTPPARGGSSGPANPSQPVPARGAVDKAPPPVQPVTGTDANAPLAPKPPASPTPPPIPASWQAVTLVDIDRDLTFDRLPSDRSVVTPIATSDMQPEPDVVDQVAAVEEELIGWGPGVVADPVQRTRNLLGVLGVHDVAQTALEAHLPRVVFRRLLDSLPREDLIKVLYWIALHPEGGTTLTQEEVRPLQMRALPGDEEEVRNRTAIYAVKLLGRLTGSIK